MVWHDFHFDDVKVIFVSNGMYELLQSHVHAIHEHFSTIFGAEYDVILTGIHDIVVYRRMRLISPALKGRGFTAILITQKRPAGNSKTMRNLIIASRNIMFIITPLIRTPVISLPFIMILRS